MRANNVYYIIVGRYTWCVCALKCVAKRIVANRKYQMQFFFSPPLWLLYELRRPSTLIKISYTSARVLKHFYEMNTTHTHTYVYIYIYAPIKMCTWFHVLQRNYIFIFRRTHCVYWGDFFKKNFNVTVLFQHDNNKRNAKTFFNSYNISIAIIFYRYIRTLKHVIVTQEETH